MTRRLRHPVRWSFLSANRVTLASAALLVFGTAGAAAFGGARGGQASAAKPLARVHSASLPGFPVPAGLPTVRRAPACPLTRSQERKAVDAFKKLLPVVMHPRCFNCHGGVNPFVDKRQGGHLGGAISQAGGFIRQQKTCQECHSELPGWELPPDTFFFVGKSPYDLCVQFKKFNPTPGGLVGHLDNDNGKGPPFTMTAFKGDRALNDMAKDISAEETHRRFTNQPPPIGHDEFVARAQAWVDAMGDGYTVKPDCGCIPTGSAWVGTVKAWWEQRTPELGTYTATATSNVRFVIDSSYDVTDDPAEYWKSVSGTINWQTSNVGGQCRIGGSGSAPIGLGADQNPMATLRGEHDDNGGMKYSVALGPWPDQYDPRITWDCPEHHIQTSNLGVYIWWNHDVAAGMNSPDGKTLKGTYRGSVAQAVMSWEWDLHLEP